MIKLLFYQRSRLLFIMRITVANILLSSMLITASSAATVNGQEILARKVSLDVKNKVIKNVLSEIEKQAAVKFTYRPRLIKANRKVTLSVSEARVKDVLDLLFNEGISYEVIEGQIVLLPSAEPPPIENDEIQAVQLTVSGKITDESGPLPGVNIVEKGTTNGATSDVNGLFTLSVANQNSILVFSYIGYNTQELTVGSQSYFEVIMTVEPTMLNEVVVVGYGTSQKTSLTTAVSSVSKERIEKLSITRVEQALQGNVAGVLVLNQNGQPGDKPMIRIRGTGTNNSPDPLFLVDGLPIGNIEYLSPNDIERIDVLKDAASAAIYGARGANGVILITTKTGKKGSSAITYDGYYGVQTVWKKVPVLNAEQYATLMNESYANVNPTGTTPPYANPAALGVGTNWQNEIFDSNVPVQNHQFTASGGKDETTYLASFSYFDQQGVLGGKNSKFKRYNFRLNLDQKVTSYLKVGTNMTYVASDRNAIFDNGDQGGSVLGHALNLDPITPLFETDPAKLATYNVNAVKKGELVYGISPLATFPNPAAQLAILNNNNNTSKLFGNVYGEVNIWKGLKFRTSYGIDLSYNTSNSLTPPYFLLSGSGQPFSTVRKSMSRSFTWQTENVLSYGASFAQHNVEVLAGQSAFKYFFENLNANRNDPSPVDPNLAYLDVATDIASTQASGGADLRTLSSYFGRLAYNYTDRYFLSGVLRRDGSSRFGRNYPYAVFPSASASWVISKEAFFPSGFLNIISLLKIRASWGQNGNENLGSSFPWASTIVFGGQQYTFLNASGTEYLQSGASLGRIANPYLKWETSEQTDVGLDVELWKGKLSVTADYYIKKTKDLLIAPDVPIIVGFQAPFVNGGSVENKGIELGLDYQDEFFNDLGVNVSFNISHNQNVVTAINNNAKVIPGAAYINMGSITRMSIGEPIGYFWGQVTDGIFQNQDEVNAYTWTDPVTNVVNIIQPNAKPGDLKFVDNNNDGKINDLDRKNIGNPNPKYVSGLTINLSYKNFDLNMFAIGMFGHQVFNGNYRFDKAVSNLPEKWLNRWTPTNTNTDVPRFAAGSANFSTVSDFYLEKGDFVRVKNIQLGYTIPKPIIQKIKISSARFYVAVDNAFTFTKYTGFDPELGATSPLSLGIDRGVYPQSITLRLGVNLKI